MRITEVQIMPIKANNGLIAFASVLFEDCLYLGSIGVHKKLDGSGYRITYPNKTIGNKNIDVYHPINKETSKAIEEAIVERVEELLGS